MISIIICSRHNDITETLKENIASTIGVEYELIIIDNSNKEYSIFQAYNEGVRRSKYSYLCFMHDDILYHTINWGRNVLEHFKDEKVGLIGVLGGHYLPKKQAHFWDSPFISGHIIQNIDGNSLSHFHDDFLGLKNSIEAVACDGLWFCIPLKLFEKIKFDEYVFNGFHLYDMDISLQVINCGYSVRIIANLLVEHFNKSIINKIFYDNQLLFFDKWKYSMPLVRGITGDCIAKYLEEINYKLEEINYKLEFENKQLHNSRAYRLGKLFMMPFSFIYYKILRK